MTIRLAVCASCAQPIYLNLEPSRTVDAWAHHATGSRYCDLTERTVAEPAADMTATDIAPTSTMPSLSLLDGLTA